MASFEVVLFALVNFLVIFLLLRHFDYLADMCGKPFVLKFIILTIAVLTAMAICLDFYSTILYSIQK